MKNKIFLLLCIAITVLISCSLERTPFDPIASGIWPPSIDSLWTVNKKIIWNVAVTDSGTCAEGYYIYGAYTENYYGKYNLIWQNESKNDTTFSPDGEHISGEYVWFKVSPYIIVYSDTLVGHLSEPIVRPY